MFPSSLGEPAVAFDDKNVMIGLVVNNAPLGEIAQIIVPARRIELRVIS
jgi:hypothetical protein